MTNREKLNDLLFSNRTLIHNLLLEDAVSLREEAEKAGNEESKNVLNQFAASRAKLAKEIREFDEREILEVIEFVLARD